MAESAGPEVQCKIESLGPNIEYTNFGTALEGADTRERLARIDDLIGTMNPLTVMLTPALRAGATERYARRARTALSARQGTSGQSWVTSPSPSSSSWPSSRFQ
jgi:hypothetical protein